MTIAASPSGDPNVDEPTEAGVVADLAFTAATPKTLDPSVPQAFVVPDGYSVTIPDLSLWRDRPKRKTGVYRPADVDAFTAYVKNHADPKATTVWVGTTGQVVAVLDDNSRDLPAWGGHRAILDLTPTPEWVYWTRGDGVAMTQEGFAEHVEGGLEEIVEPDGATMLEIAQSFHATVGATFRQSTRLSTGEQRLQYDEDVQATAGRSGDLNVPTVVKLAVAPFIGEERYAIIARFRFRLAGGKLSLSYKLDRPDSVIRDALDGVAGRLVDAFPNTYVGSPAE